MGWRVLRTPAGVIRAAASPAAAPAAAGWPDALGCAPPTGVGSRIPGPRRGQPAAAGGQSSCRGAAGGERGQRGRLEAPRSAQPAVVRKLTHRGYAPPPAGAALVHCREGSSQHTLNGCRRPIHPPDGLGQQRGLPAPASSPLGAHFSNCTKIAISPNRY